MWIFALIATAVIGYFLFNKIIDKETKKNFSFLIKVMSILFGVLFVLGIIISINNN